MSLNVLMNGYLVALKQERLYKKCCKFYDKMQNKIYSIFDKVYSKYEKYCKL